MTSELAPAEIFSRYEQVRREYLDDAAYAIDELGAHIGAAAVEAMAVLQGKQHESCDIHAKIAPHLKESAAQLKEADRIRDELKEMRAARRGARDDDEYRIHADLGVVAAHESHRAARKAAECLTAPGHIVYTVKHIEGQQSIAELADKFPHTQHKPHGS